MSEPKKPGSNGFDSAVRYGDPYHIPTQPAVEPAPSAATETPRTDAAWGHPAVGNLVREDHRYQASLQLECDLAAKTAELEEANTELGEQDTEIIVLNSHLAAALAYLEKLERAGEELIRCADHVNAVDCANGNKREKLRCAIYAMEQAIERTKSGQT